MLLALRGETRLPRLWQGIWFAALVFWLAFVAAVASSSDAANSWRWERDDWVAWTASIALFVHCLLMVNLGLLLGSRFFINLGVCVLTFDVIIAYIRLFGTMAVTGAMFIVSGVGLIVLGVFIERRRRALMRELAQRSTTPTP